MLSTKGCTKLGFVLHLLGVSVGPWSLSLVNEVWRVSVHCEGSVCVRSLHYGTLWPAYQM